MELALEESLNELNFKEGDSEETVKKAKKASFEKFEIVIIIHNIKIILLEGNRG